MPKFRNVDHVPLTHDLLNYCAVSSHCDQGFCFIVLTYNHHRATTRVTHVPTHPHTSWQSDRTTGTTVYPMTKCSYLLSCLTVMMSWKHHCLLTTLANENGSKRSVDDGIFINRAAACVSSQSPWHRIRRMIQTSSTPILLVRILYRHLKLLRKKIRTDVKTRCFLILHGSVLTSASWSEIFSTLRCTT